MAVDSFGGIILDDAPAQTRQPQRDQFGGIIQEDSPQPVATAPAPQPSTVDTHSPEWYINQKWTQLGEAALQSQGPKIVRSADEAYRQQHPGETRLVTEESEKTLPNAIDYAKNSIPPEQRQGFENKWRQEYAAIPRHVWAGLTVPPGPNAPEVGRTAGLVNAGIRGSTEVVTTPVQGGTNFILGAAQNIVNTTTNLPTGPQEGVDVNGGNTAAGRARQLSQKFLNTAVGNIDKSLPKSTEATQNPGGWQAFFENNAEQLPQLAMLTPAFQAGGLQVALANSQIGASLFQGAYTSIYQAGRQHGLSDSDANNVAMAGGAVDAVVNTYLMKFGVLGDQGPESSRLRSVLNKTLANYLTQGAVGGSQQGITEATKYLATGESPNIEAVLNAAKANAAVGGALGLVHGVTGEVSGPESRQGTHELGNLNVRSAGGSGVGGPDVSAGVPVPSPEVMKTLTTAPEPKAGLTDKTTPKYRIQDGAESKGVPIEFESRDDKLHYLATQPRVGKVGKQAIQELKDRGFSDDQIESYGAELRDRVDKLAKGSAGDSIRVPAAATPEAPAARNNPPVPGGESKLSVGGVQPAEVKNATVESPVVQPASPEAVVQPVAGRPGTPAEAKPSVQNGEKSIAGTVQPAVSGPDVARAEAALPQIRPQARIVKPSKLVAGASKAVEGVLGVKVIHIQDEGGAAGFTNPDHPGVVFIDARRPVKAWAEVLAHEWMHTVQDKDGATAKAFYDAIPDAQKAKYLETYKAALTNLKGIDTARYLTPEVTEREIGAMALQNAATRSSVRRQLLGQKAGVWEKIVEAGQGLWDKLTGKHQIVDKAIDLIREKAVKPEEANAKVSEAAGPVAVSAGSEAAASTRAEVGRVLESKGTAPAEVKPAEVPKPVRAKRRPREVEAQGTLFAPKGSERVQQEAEEYTKAAGVPYIRRSEYAEVNVDRAKKIAAAYDLATHSPNDPKVKASYDAFKKETLDQWNYLKSKGVKFEAWDKEGQPYKNSEEMRADVTNNKHLYFFQGGDLPSDHPLAASAPGTPYTYNDVFRAVHDYFGHTKEGVGFGPRGEENAWRSHSAMYSDAARGAMTTETRGQNSWVNFGPHGEANQANPAETKYAEQKATLLLPEYAKVDETSFSPKTKEEKELYKHLTEEERSSLTAPEAKRALDVFRSLPPDEEFAAAAKAGLAKKGWYEKAGAALIDLFGPDTRRFTALLAADSPRQTVEKNLAESLRIWHAWDKAGRPTDEAQISALLGDVMETRRPNIMRALKGANELSGYKVSNFKENLLGNLQAVTNDAWMAKFGDIEQKVFADNGGYLGYTAKVRRVAKKIGLEPAQVQETIWSFFKTLSERINRDTTGHEALSNLKHEDVAAAPAFADMLGDEDVRTALKQLGLTEQSIRRAEGSAEAAGPGEEPPAGYVAEGRKSVLSRIAERAEKYAKNQPSEMSKSQRTLFYPGEQFVEKDIKPAAEKFASTMKDIWEGVKAVSGLQNSREAKITKGLLRERGAEIAQRIDRLRAAFEETRKHLDKNLTQAQKYDITDSAERGYRQTDPALQPVADNIRAIYDDRLAQMQKRGKLKDFVENYMGHLYEDPKRASTVLSGLSRRPLEGSKGFLKQRTIPFQSDAIAAGLKPVTDNPVEMMYLKTLQMDKYIAAHDVFKQLKDSGVLKFIKAKERTPDGYAKIDDKIATVFTQASNKAAIQTQGYYVAPAPAASVINNYLDLGIGGSKYFGGLYRGYMGGANVLNQVQLGLSAFHGTGTVINAGVSKLALAMEQAQEGKLIEASKSLGSAATGILPAIQAYRKGSLMEREWTVSGSTTPEMKILVDAMKAGGGRNLMDENYRTRATAGMMKALREGNIVGAALRSPFAAIEQAAKPIMEKLVPRIKKGVFAELMRNELEKIGPGASREELQSAAGSAWNSVDSRFGQVVYDNVFANRTVKDIAMAVTRAPGWTGGTLAELGGGALDLAFGKGLKVSHRSAYMLALPIFTAYIGGMIHYGLNGTPPQTLKDFFYPRTGKQDKEGHDERLSLPTYMNDVVAYGKAPLTTLKHKSSPLVNLIEEIVNNEDHAGVEIRHPDDNPLQQGKQLAKHIGGALVPFGIRNVSQLMGEGQGARSLLPLVGINKARADISHSPAEMKALEIAKDRQPPGRKTQAEAEKASQIRDLSNSLKAKEPGAREAIRDAAKAGELTEADIQNIRNRQKFSGLLERTIKGMEPEDAMRVWAVMDGGERRRLGPQMFAKMRSSKSLSREDRVAFVKQLQADWAKLKAGAVPQGSEE
jgi:hypothetical protein